MTPVNEIVLAAIAADFVGRTREIARGGLQSGEPIDARANVSLVGRIQAVRKTEKKS